jgi:hypothetical protein
MHDAKVPAVHAAGALVHFATRITLPVPPVVVQ